METMSAVIRKLDSKIDGRFASLNTRVDNFESKA